MIKIQLKYITPIITWCLILCTGILFAQCPVNIGFDTGDFTNWKGYEGTISDGQGIIQMDPASAIVFDRQTIINRSDKMVDPFGRFALVSPNGSNSIVKLGNSYAGAEAERLTYTFTVPANNNNFSLIYYYAVVLEDAPGHTDQTKPKFNAAVFDAASNQPLTCGNFNFVNISKLPGFKKAPVQNTFSDVYYKDWSAVTVDLSGYAGKTVRLEFTTNDCEPGAHFGYAYIDINQNCTSPVSGNIICVKHDSVTLNAPAGFAAYKWYAGRNFTTVLSTDANYVVTPVPPMGTKFSVIIIPYPTLGCQDTVTTTIQAPQNLVLNVTNRITTCANLPIDLTDPAITKGSDSSYVFTYYYNEALNQIIDDPKHIANANTYYIKATPASGCFTVVPVSVSYLSTSSLVITPPAEVCYPTPVNLKSMSITQGSTFANQLSYWMDSLTTVPIQKPDAIQKSGTYYIKALNTTNGCADVKPVLVLVDDKPIVKTTAVKNCIIADITASTVTTGSSPDLKFFYFADSLCTQLIGPSAAKVIAASGKYYIVGINVPGCADTASVQVTIFPPPQISVTDPAAVAYPATVDITQTFMHDGATVYTYFSDKSATKTLADAAKIGKNGTYYIKATNGNGCEFVTTVKVTITPPQPVNYAVNTFTPNGDGINDKFRIVTPATIKVNHFRIYGSWGGLVYDATDSNNGWDGTYKGKKMPIGTYYWIFDAFDTYTSQAVKQSGSVTLVL